MEHDYACEALQESAGAKSLRDFKALTHTFITEAQQEGVVPPSRMKNILDLAEEFGLVSRQGMATGLHYPLREEKYIKAGEPVDAELVTPTLKHVLKQAQRAVNIERRGGHQPRESHPLYGRWNFLAKTLRYR